MKKYSLTIVFDDEKEEISSVKQEITELDPKSAPKELKVSMNSQFAEQLPQLKQEVVNSLFSAADKCGGQMGDA